MLDCETARLSQVAKGEFSSFKPPPVARPVSAPVSGIVGGRYRKEALLGYGGFAIVYAATDLMTNEKVAIKLYRRHSDCLGIESTMQRAKLVSDIIHKNLVRIKNAGITKEGIFIVMELLEGQDLATMISKGNAMPWDTLKGMAMQACDGLQTLHERGMVHKDVKSANIFITEHGLVKIIDFDISRYRLFEGQTEFGTVEGSFIGTPSYASPEEAKGKSYDHRTDIYSLGVVMYEAICGFLPFIGIDPVSTLTARLHKTPMPPSRNRPNLDIPLCADMVILKAMEFHPEHRYQSMGEMRKAIQQA